MLRSKFEVRARAATNARLARLLMAASAAALLDHTAALAAIDTVARPLTVGMRLKAKF